MRKNVAGQRVVFSLFKAGARIANPTMAANDFTVALDGAGQNNVATLPTSDAAGKVVWLPSQAETNADTVTFLANDVLGAEWEPVTLHFDTVTNTAVATMLADYSTLTQADILDDSTPFSGADIDAAISTRGTADPGDAMMLTVAEREAIDTVLSLVHGADSWSATGGSDVVSVLNAIRNKTDRIGTGRAIMVSPVIVDGTVRIVKGDAYYDTDGRRLEWSDEEWNIIDTSVLVMIIHGETTFVATRLSATSVGLELSSVQTLALDAGNMRYSLQEITVGGDTISRVHDAPMYIASQPLPVYAP